MAGALKSTEENDKFTTRFATPQPDLSYVNPMAASVQSSAADVANVRTEKLAVNAANMQELINQMVEKAQEMTVGGKTETTVTLNDKAGVFSGTNIVLTSYETAKNEFNVSFENLKNEAKALLDMRINQDSLKQTMLDKGFTVHIITTTTQIEKPIITAQTSQGQADRERDPRERRRQQQQQG